MDEVEVYQIDARPDFERGIKRLVTKKKFLSLPAQVRELKEKFQSGNFEGDRLSHNEHPTPYDIYKVRLPNPDTNVGKSDGYRIIYMVVIEKKIVIMLTIYYKKEDATVSDVYINGLIDGYFMNSLPEEE